MNLDDFKDAYDRCKSIHKQISIIETDVNIIVPFNMFKDVSFVLDNKIMKYLDSDESFESTIFKIISNEDHDSINSLMQYTEEYYRNLKSKLDDVHNICQKKDINSIHALYEEGQYYKMQNKQYYTYVYDKAIKDMKTNLSNWINSVWTELVRKIYDPMVKEITEVDIFGGSDSKSFICIDKEWIHSMRFEVENNADKYLWMKEFFKIKDYHECEDM